VAAFVSKSCHEEYKECLPLSLCHVVKNTTSVSESSCEVDKECLSLPLNKGVS